MTGLGARLLLLGALTTTGCGGGGGSDRPAPEQPAAPQPLVAPVDDLAGWTVG